MEMSNRKYSIIVVTLNNADGLKRTLQSVSALRYLCFEVVVIDGASTDTTKTVVEGFSEFITVFVSEKDNGIYNAQNKGLEASVSPYLLFLNSGDYLRENNVLEKVFPYLDGADIVYGNEWKVIEKEAVNGTKEKWIEIKVKKEGDNSFIQRLVHLEYFLYLIISVM